MIGKLELFDIDPDAWPVIDAGLQYLIDSIVPPQAAVVPAAAGVAADVESSLEQQLLRTELSEVERTVSEVERTAHIYRASASATHLMLQDEREKWRVESSKHVDVFAKLQTTNDGFKKQLCALSKMQKGAAGTGRSRGGTAIGRGGAAEGSTRRRESRARSR